MAVRDIAALALLFVAATGLAACDKPSHDECKNACSRIVQIAKEQFDIKVKDLPDEWKQRGWLDSKVAVEPLVDSCAAACVDVGKRSLVDCLTAAKTADAFTRCTQPE